LNISNQNTLAKEVSCVGVGLHSGDDVTMTLRPADEDTGIVFVRKDVKGFNPMVKADFRNVSATNLGTSIANNEGTMVATIEHLMAAFWGCDIDNAIVELDGPEVPIMDGSSEPFVFLIECAGIQKQEAPRKIIEVLKPVEVRADNKIASFKPAENFSVSLEIDFKNSVISSQKCVFDSSDVSFKTDLCRARTFGFEDEVSYLRSQGLAKGGSLKNAVVVGKDKVLNEEGLRYQNEFVRHKILDCIGDFYLIGAHIKGSFSGYRSGHDLNNRLLHKFFEDKDAWRLLPA